MALCSFYKGQWVQFRDEGGRISRGFWVTEDVKRGAQVVPVDTQYCEDSTWKSQGRLHLPIDALAPDNFTPSAPLKERSSAEKKADDLLHAWCFQAGLVTKAPPDAAADKVPTSDDVGSPHNRLLCQPAGNGTQAPFIVVPGFEENPLGAPRLAAQSTMRGGAWNIYEWGGCNKLMSRGILYRGLTEEQARRFVAYGETFAA